MTSFRIRAALLIALGLICLSPVQIYAQEAQEVMKIEPVSEEQSPQESIAPDDYKALESTGTYTRETDGQLSQDFWKGMKRSEATMLLEAMPASSPNKGLQSLIFGVLLGESDAGQLKNDIEIENGADLLTLRLEKLIEGGAYTQANALYDAARAEPYHPRLARASLLAKLYTGEKSLACLDIKTFDKTLKANEFIKTLQAYCAASLRKEETDSSAATLESSGFKILSQSLSPDFTFSYTPESFSALPQIEQAILTADKKIKLAPLSLEDIQTVPPQHIEILLQNWELSEHNRFFLTARALKFGLKPTSAMKELYSAMITPASGGGLKEKTVETLGEEWQKIPYFYHVASAAASEEAQWEAIESTLPLVGKYGPDAFLPYSDLLYLLGPTDKNLPNLEAAVKILSVSRYSFPQNWDAIISQIEDKNNNFLEKKLKSVAYIHTLNTDSYDKLIASLSQNTSQSEKATLFLKKVIENIDKHELIVNNADKVYEKELDLTQRLNYVMPNAALWNQLRFAGQTQNFGETVLLSTLVLQNTDPNTIYPGLYGDVLKSLNKVGLTTVSRAMATADILEALN